MVTTALRAILAATVEGQSVLRADIIDAVVEVLGAHPDWCGHAGLLAAMAEVDLAASRTDAQVEARRTPGTTASLHLQADLTAALGTLLAPAKRAAE